MNKINFKSTKLIAGVASITMAISTACTGRSADERPTVIDETAQQTFAYRNAVNLPPANWTGPVFELSDHYPTEPQSCVAAGGCPWLEAGKNLINTTAETDTPLTWNDQWQAYIDTIFDYIKEGQTDDLNNNDGFNVEVNGQTRWFSIPWMAYDQTVGREFIHGLTNERTAVIDDFFPNRSAMFEAAHSVLDNDAGYETWAVGYYNNIAAYSIGQAWSKLGAPVKGNIQGVKTLKGLPFREGSVVVKLLFTTASPKDVPYLASSPEWMANRHVLKGDIFTCDRSPQPVRLVQMDIAVVDKNSPTNWVYGTYAYHNEKQTGTAWDNLLPVGIQWGMDEWTFPAVPKSESIPPRQTVLRQETPDQHFGCQGRLAGPVDNRESSCLSCHGGAFATSEGATFFSGPFSPPVFGFDGLCNQYSQDNVNYFQTIRFPQSYSGGQFNDLLNLDTSLQMQIAFQQWNYFKQLGKPQACTID